MPYIDRDATIHDSMPWGMAKVSSMFWGFLNIVYLFFTTLIPGLRSNDAESVSFFRAPRGGGGGGGGGGGWGGGSGGGGPPRPPRPRSNFRSFSDTFGRGSMNVPGGCAGGSCGRS